MIVDQALRDRITTVVCDALRPLPEVLAGWEGGSAAFDAVDGYSDIDLNFIVRDDASFDTLYACAERALATISPIAASYTPPKGRYYKLQDAGDYLLLDLIFLRAGDTDHFLEAERHGNAIPLFDKADWLRPRSLDEQALDARRGKRLQELQDWFVISQGFVRKQILRGHHAEAVATYWAVTMRPLAELLRMRHCPARWDFGIRYLDRDVPAPVYDRIRDLAFVRDLEDLDDKLTRATAWGAALLQELA